MMTQVESKKRRLSKKEQKLRKKQRKQTKNSSCRNNNEQLQQLKEEETGIKLCTNSEEGSTTTQNPTTTPSSQQKETVLAVDPSSYLKDYVPIPVPPPPEEDLIIVEESRTTSINAKAIKGWFPSARVVKCDPATPPDDGGVKTCSIVLFYQYVAVTNEHHMPWTKQRVHQLQNYLIQVAEARKSIGGRIRISVEGVNATVSSLGPEGVRYMQQDLLNFDPIAFQHTDFKFIDNLPPDRHFTSMKILPVKELVYYGFHQQEKQNEPMMTKGDDNNNNSINEDMVAPLHQGGVHLDPKSYHEKLKMDNTVVIDVRNHYEADIGRFDGQQQQQQQGAEYIDPKMRKSTDFAQWIQQPQVQDKLKGKQVLMFCTVRQLLIYNTRVILCTVQPLQITPFSLFLLFFSYWIGRYKV